MRAGDQNESGAEINHHFPGGEGQVGSVMQAEPFSPLLMEAYKRRS